MAEIIQGTTPRLAFELPDVDVSKITKLKLDIYQGNVVIHKNLDEVSLNARTSSVEFSLSDKETLSFSAGVIKVQIRFMLENDTNIYGTHSVPLKVIPLGVAEPFLDTNEDSTSEEGDGDSAGSVSDNENSEDGKSDNDSESDSECKSGYRCSVCPYFYCACKRS